MAGSGARHHPPTYSTVCRHRISLRELHAPHCRRLSSTQRACRGGRERANGPRGQANVSSKGYVRRGEKNGPPGRHHTIPPPPHLEAAVLASTAHLWTLKACRPVKGPAVQRCPAARRRGGADARRTSPSLFPFPGVWRARSRWAGHASPLPARGRGGCGGRRQRQRRQRRRPAGGGHPHGVGHGGNPPGHAPSMVRGRQRHPPPQHPNHHLGQPTCLSPPSRDPPPGEGMRGPPPPLCGCGHRPK